MKPLSFKKLKYLLYILIAIFPEALASSYVQEYSLNGIWENQPYGWVLEISEESVELHHHTTYGCITDEGDDIVENLQHIEWVDENTILAGPDPQSTKYRFVRLQEKPSICSIERPNLPSSVLEFAISFMEDHYAFFDVRLLDWEDRVQRARALVNNNTDDEDLHSALVSLIDDSGDGHLGIVVEVDGEEISLPYPQSRTLIPALVQANQNPKLDRNDVFLPWWIDRVNSAAANLIEQGGSAAAAGPLIWNKFEDTGYILIGLMTNYSASQELEDDLATINAALDIALTELADTESIMIDVSLNLGGTDRIAMEIARRFAQERTFAFAKRPIGSPIDQAQHFYVEPTERVAYTGPIHLLTSDLTESAAEVFTLAMKALPNVIHYGTATHGSLSDSLEKPLPNGWSITLSNEIYSDENGIVWEGHGIPADVEFELYNSQTISTENHVDLLLDQQDIFEIEDNAFFNLTASGLVGTQERTLIAGLIIRGDSPRDLAITARGPSLFLDSNQPSVQDVDLRIFDSNLTEIHYTHSIDQLNVADSEFLQELSVLPTHPNEAAAILRSIPPGSYHIHLSSQNASTGFGTVDVFDITQDLDDDSSLINLSVRAHAESKVNSLKADFMITGQKSLSIVARTRGPSLTNWDIQSPLSNPILEIYRKDEESPILAVSNFMELDAEVKSLLHETGFATESQFEAAAIAILPSGSYTALLKASDGSIPGIALLELFDITDDDDFQTKGESIPNNEYTFSQISNTQDSPLATHWNTEPAFQNIKASSDVQSEKTEIEGFIGVTSTISLFELSDEQFEILLNQNEYKHFTVADIESLEIEFEDWTINEKISHSEKNHPVAIASLPNTKIAIYFN